MTAAGEAEMLSPTTLIASSTRDLLVALDRATPLEQWLTTAALGVLKDVGVLLSLGLVQATPCQATGTREDSAAIQGVIDALLVLHSTSLYAILTEQARQRLGLLHGFRMVLALEKCDCEDDYRALAIRFALEVWRVQGAEGLGLLRARLLV